MSTPVCVYARSGSSPEDLAREQAICLQYAASHDYVLVQDGLFLDLTSADATRPGLASLRNAIEAGACEVVVALSPDRLTGDAGELHDLLDAAKARGIRVEFVDSAGG